MKNSTLITGAVIIGGLALLASETFASYNSGYLGTQAGRGMGRGYMRTNSGTTANSNYSTYGVNVKREVKNIENGVEVTMTTTDAATLAHMKTMFAQNSAKTPKNSLIKVTRTELPNGTKVTMTSTDPATVKQIQERAANAKSGMFGNAGQGRGGMMKGQGFGRGMGQGRGGCQFNAQ